MKKAITYRAYRNPAPFDPVQGIVTAEVDPETGALATVNCPGRRMEGFISGTQPAAYCRVHGGRPGGVPLLTTVAGWDTEPEKAPAPRSEIVIADAKPAPTLAPPQHARVATQTIPVPPPAARPESEDGKKKGLFHRIWDVFK